MKALWKNTIIADSDSTITIEGNEYFPQDSIKSEYFTPSTTHTVCVWKGEASYYTLNINGEANIDAAWYYPEPKDGSIEKVGDDFTNYVAFWRGVEVTN